ncbi:aromatic acid decarboxylase [Candidatus Micrarchaeota archaeon CG10_big_fil_rev_8_21_14_0_10_45_29]|nr:MAG: aromatic acid decarboxylase [Candidatus Micrarchaeota archaeon CG10_big_fil_rev_8_21_14_0_10_45_29]
MRILLAITGASGIIYGTRLHSHLLKTTNETKAIISQGAKKVAEAEKTPLPPADYDENDLSAPCASGSNSPDAMVICPCSLKTLGEIANGVGSNLISRSAEVCLKERKKLILVLRETPYSLITIRNMEKITLAGGIILPASPAFYHKPEKIEDLVDFICGKVMDQLKIENNLFKRWKK